jgi:hypothetical protein
MYASLSLKRLSAMLGLSFGVVLVGTILARGVPTDFWGWARTLSLTLSVWSLLMAALFGSSRKWAPWRLAWAICPQLNHWAFPDLNGKWIGTTKSNWPVIKTKIEHAERKSAKIDRTELADVPLQEDEIEIRIKASLFTFRISAQLKNTNSVSHSLAERVQKDKARDSFELYYVYVQKTPQPQLTDEAAHPGAARLDIDLDEWKLSGEYWNRRSWRSGFNAAGMLNVQRVER